MGKAAQSLFVFGLYAWVAGAAFIVAPESVLSLLHLPTMPAGWTRIVGFMALVIGTYDIVCARAGCGVFIKASIFTRLGFALGVAGLVQLGQMPGSTIFIGAVDAAGAIWTAIALRHDRLSSPPSPNVTEP
jgi:hypothetical protein